MFFTNNMRKLMMIKKLLFATALVVLAPAAQATTVIAMFTGGVGTSVTRTILTGAGTPSNNAPQTAERFNMTLTRLIHRTGFIGVANVA